MKITYLILTIILLGGLVFFLTSCNSKTKTSDQSVAQTPDTTTNKHIQPTENPFDGLRGMAFGVTPEQLGLSLSADSTLVYGVVMDMGMNGGTATIVSYKTGDASMYLSSGGGVIGGGQHPKVNSAAKLFVRMAQNYLDKSVKTDATPVPDKDDVIFYLLTNKGVYKGQIQLKKFEDSSSPWNGLFEEGNKVITELRLTGQK